MKYTNYLYLGMVTLALSSCGNSKTAEETPAHPTENTVAETAESTPETAAETVAVDSTGTPVQEEYFRDDIDFDWRGDVSHEMYDDCTYEQLMSDAEIDKIIEESKRKYYHEKKVEEIVKKDSKNMTMDEYKEAIEELKYISIYDILWARGKLEIEHMKTAGEMADDDYSKPKTACQKAYSKVAKNANHGLMDVEFNVSKLLSILRFADLDLDAKKAFYEAKKLRAYYGKVIDERNRLYKERNDN